MEPLTVCLIANGVGWVANVVCLVLIFTKSKFSLKSNGKEVHIGSQLIREEQQLVSEQKDLTKSLQEKEKSLVEEIKELKTEILSLKDLNQSLARSAETSNKVADKLANQISEAPPPPPPPIKNNNPTPPFPGKEQNKLENKAEPNKPDSRSKLDEEIKRELEKRRRKIKEED